MQRSSQVRTRGKQQISLEECCSDTVSPSAKRNKRASKMRTVDTAHVICVAGGGSIVLWQDAAEVAAAVSSQLGARGPYFEIRIVRAMPSGCSPTSREKRRKVGGRTPSQDFLPHPSCALTECQAFETEKMQSK